MNIAKAIFCQESQYWTMLKLLINMLMGQVISNIWSDKVTFFLIKMWGQSGYENLRKHIINEEDMKRIESLCQETVDSINLFCSSHSGWIVDCLLSKLKPFTLLKVPSSGVTVQGCCFLCEMFVSLDPPNITLGTQLH